MLKEAKFSSIELCDAVGDIRKHLIFGTILAGELYSSL
jgi:hypothetical protein